MGRPIKGHILAARPGHFGNTSFAKRIKEKMREEEKNAVVNFDLSKTVYDINDIEKDLLHRYPFLLVDRIVAMDNQTITGYKNITMNEPQFTGHFPEPGDARCAAGGGHGAGGRHLRAEPGARPGELHHLIPRPTACATAASDPGDTGFPPQPAHPDPPWHVHMKGMGYVNGQVAVEAEMMAQIARDKVPADTPKPAAKATA